MSAQNTSKFKRLTGDELRQRLKIKYLREKSNLSAKHPHVERFLKDKGTTIEGLRQHSAKLIGAGALTSALLLSAPADIKSLPAPHEIMERFSPPVFSGNEDLLEKNENKTVLVNLFESLLPKRTRPLSRNEEKVLEQVFNNVMGVKTRATLEGEHLNTTYGVIGAEQHLKRFPGDTVGEHGSGPILKEGIAPGLGAWGYLTPSREKLTPHIEETEKWYAVVQTLYLPDWGRRQPYLKNWYKFRKVLIVNTNNGNAVVASIADSGPAAWTGKHYGGSPEVMNHLGGLRYKKGTVITFFVDDPENKVPLGPVEYN